MSFAVHRAILSRSGNEDQMSERTGGFKAASTSQLRRLVIKNSQHLTSHLHDRICHTHTPPQSIPFKLVESTMTKFFFSYFRPHILRAAAVNARFSSFLLNRSCGNTTGLASLGPLVHEQD